MDTFHVRRMEGAGDQDDGACHIFFHATGEFRTREKRREQMLI